MNNETTNTSYESKPNNSTRIDHDNCDTITITENACKEINKNDTLSNINLVTGTVPNIDQINKDATLNKKNKKIYYAHPKSLYNTPQEARDIMTLKSMGFDVLNPSDPIYQNEFENTLMDESQYMNFFFNLVKSCNALAFRSFIDGSIGTGVYSEIQKAYEYCIPVIELPTNLNRRGLTLNETRSILSELGNR